MSELTRAEVELAVNMFEYAYPPNQTDQANLSLSYRAFKSWLTLEARVRALEDDLQRSVLECIKPGWCHPAIRSHAEHLQEKYGFKEHGR